AGCAKTLLRLAGDIDGLLELAAVIACSVTPIPRRGDGARVAGLGVVPADLLADRSRERAVLRTLHLQAVGAIQRLADLVAEEAPTRDPAARRDQPAGAAADLRTQKAAEAGADERTADLLFALAGVRTSRKRERHCGRKKGFADSHGLRPFADSSWYVGIDI